MRPKLSEMPPEPLTTAELMERWRDSFADFCDEQNISSMKDESSSMWLGCMMYCAKKAFNGGKLLATSEYKEIRDPHNFKPYTTVIYYNPVVLWDLVDIYIYLCQIYSKEVSLLGFSTFTSTPIDMYCPTADRRGDRLNDVCNKIYQKIHAFREQSLLSKLYDNKNAVAQIAVLNKHFGYNMPGVRQNTPQITQGADSLPRLVSPSNIAEISQNDD